MLRLGVGDVESSIRLNNGGISTNDDPRPQNKYLWHGEGNQVWQHCTVSETDFEPGFPCIDKDMPRVKK